MTLPDRRILSLAFLALAIALAGCAVSGGAVAPGTPRATAAGAVQSATPGATTTAAPSSPAPSSPAPSSAAPSPSAIGAVLDQAWATAPLVDVATGETFTIADHAGEVIILETMAIWCSNCRAQQRDVMSALQELPAGAVTYIALDVDPNEDGPSLARYQELNGFKGRYAVAETSVARALAAEFGDQVLNPPSTPVVVIGTDGKVTLTEFGHKTSDELVALATAHGA